MADVLKDPGVYHPPGIYLGMSEVEYHSDEALGSTDIRKLATDPWMWQTDRLHRSLSRVTEHMKWGSALHCLVLEGIEEFEKRYAVKPIPEDFGVVGKDVLVTGDHIKKWLRDHEKPISKLNKEQLVRSVEMFLAHPILYDREIEKFEAVPRVSDDYVLKKEQLQEIRNAVWQMEQHPVLNAVMTAGSLTKGAGELSIFYEYRGWRRKHRFDYAIPPLIGRTHAMLCDLKSFANFRGNDSEKAAVDTMYRNAFDVQAVDYLNGFDKGLELFEQGKIFGEEPRENFVQELFTAPEVQWVWIMIHKDKGFIPNLLWFMRGDETYKRDIHWQHIETLNDLAIDNLEAYSEKFAFDEMWSPLEYEQPLRITKEELPYWNRGF